MSRLNRSVCRLAHQAAVLGTLAASAPLLQGCSVHASWEAGTSTSEGQVRNERAQAHDDTEARKRRREAELARIDREAKERVAQAERDAAEQERAAEQEAERQRQEAEAEAARKRQEEEAAAAEAAKKPALRRHGVAAGGTFVNADGSPQSGAQSGLDARKAEIEQAMADKKVTIRQKLEQNKADILVAAERKRNEVQATIKDEPEAKP